MLILTQYIAKHEFRPLDRFLNIDDILEGATKVSKGLATQIKSPSKTTPGFKFFKVRIGKKNNARMIVFIVTGNKKIVPVLIRLKKDKLFGMNMAMNNQKVVDQMNKNMDNILTDIDNKQFEEFEIND